MHITLTRVTIWLQIPTLNAVEKLVHKTDLPSTEEKIEQLSITIKSNQHPKIGIPLQAVLGISWFSRLHKHLVTQKYGSSVVR